MDRKSAQRGTAIKQKRKKSTKTLRQEVFLDAYKHSLFNITKSCEATKIGRRTVYTWLENDPEFNDKFEDAKEERLDFIEDSLFKKIKQGHVIACIFALKCLGHKRGWQEENSLKIKPVIENLSKERTDEIVQAAIDSDRMSRQLQLGVYKPNDE